MKNFRQKYSIIISLLFVSFLPGCLFDVTYYKHPPTDKMRKKITVSDFEKKSDFKTEDILFVPDFSEFSISAIPPRSFLLGFSKSPQSVVIDKIVLSSAKGDSCVELYINEKLDINEPKHGLYSGNISLTGLGHSDFNSLKNENIIDLEIYFKSRDLKQRKVYFRLIRVNRKDIAWVT